MPLTEEVCSDADRKGRVVGSQSRSADCFSDPSRPLIEGDSSIVDKGCSGLDVAQVDIGVCGLRI